MQDEIREYDWQHMVTRDLFELRNLAPVAERIVRGMPAELRATSASL